MKIVSLFFAAGVAGTIAGCGNDVGANEEFNGWAMPLLTPSQGFSFRVPPYEVEAGTEAQNCYFVKVPDLNGDGSPFWINQINLAQNPGSHHLNVFRVKTLWNLTPTESDAEPTNLGGEGFSYPTTVVKGGEAYSTSPCWQSSNWADWPLVANDQNSSVTDPYFSWQLPDNVAIQFQPGEMLMVQSHYVNSTQQATPWGAHVGLNFIRDTVDANPQGLGTLFATQQNIRVCQSDPKVSYSGQCNLPANTTLTAANGHFHSRGVEFDMYPWDGVSITTPPASTRFYQSLNWNTPPMVTNLNIQNTDGGIWWTCNYEWQPPEFTTCADVNARDPLQQNDCCYTFGGDTFVGEHCNVFAYYYPVGSNGDVFCN